MPRLWGVLGQTVQGLEPVLQLTAPRSLLATGTGSSSAFPGSLDQELAEGIAWSGVITFHCLPPLCGQEEQGIVMERMLTKEVGGKKLGAVAAWCARLAKGQCLCPQL